MKEQGCAIVDGREHELKLLDFYYEQKDSLQSVLEHQEDRGFLLHQARHAPIDAARRHCFGFAPRYARLDC